MSLTPNRIYSTGISTLVPCSFKNQMALAGWNTKQGSLSSAGIWTLDKDQSMKEYLYLGARSIMSNCAPIALGVMKGLNLPLAGPGLAYAPATSNDITRAGTNAPCDSNDNCDGGACGRTEQGNDNAPLVCCPPGSSITHSVTLHDFCSITNTNALAVGTKLSNQNLVPAPAAAIKQDTKDAAPAPAAGATQPFKAAAPAPPTSLPPPSKAAAPAPPTSPHSHHEAAPAPACVGDENG